MYDVFVFSVMRNEADSPVGSQSATLLIYQSAQVCRGWESYLKAFGVFIKEDLKQAH